MANLVPFSKLKVGTTYFEEADIGTELTPVKVIERIDSKHIRFEHPFYNKPVILKERRSFRYWDEKPTYEEYNWTDWRY